MPTNLPPKTEQYIKRCILRHPTLAVPLGGLPYDCWVQVEPYSDQIYWSHHCGCGRVVPLHQMFRVLDNWSLPSQAYRVTFGQCWCGNVLWAVRKIGIDQL